MRPIGNPKQLSERRQRALKLLKGGKRSTQVAQLLGVTPRSLRRWRQAAKIRRPPRRAKRSPGCPCRLTPKQLKRLERSLARGALASGYSGDYWTVQRIRSLIRKLFGVRYQPHSVWYLLRRMKWSCQKPQRVGWQHDEAAIAYWKRYRWPRIKKMAKRGRDPCFSRRKWQIAGVSDQTNLGTAWSDAHDSHVFESSPARQCDRCLADYTQSAPNQIAGEGVSADPHG